MTTQSEKQTSFQFKAFRIVKSSIERKEGKLNSGLNLNFDPRGQINKKEKKFHLTLGVDIEDEDKIFQVSVVAVGEYTFVPNEDANLDNFFFLNAPAILFPYIRAYISTLTNLSGFSPINLPTLNMEGLKEVLKKNTNTIEE